MKIKKLFLSFTLLLIINSTLSKNQRLKAETNDDKLPKSICKIVNDIIKTKTDTQNILFGNLSEKYFSAVTNDIASCIDGQVSAVITDFRAKIVETKLWKASIMILIFDTIDEVSINNICSVILLKYFEKLHFFPVHMVSCTS